MFTLTLLCRPALRTTCNNIMWRFPSALQIKSDVIADTNDKTIRRIVLHTDVTCIPLETEGKRAKRQFLLRIMSDNEDKKSTEEEEEAREEEEVS